MRLHLPTEAIRWSGRSWRPAAALLVAAAALCAAATQAQAVVQVRSDSPAGFWYGTDSHQIAITGNAPYSEPAIGGRYGGYIGMIGNWAAWQHCHGQVVFSGTDSRRADTNFSSYQLGIGTGVYWFMAGPGVDPNYNGTRSEAYAWGEAQAQRVVADLEGTRYKITYPVVFMDVEIPGNAPSYTPAPDNGWNSVYTSACSGVVKQDSIPAAVDRADFNGFAAYLTTHSSYEAGVYSAPSIWASIFGTGKPSQLSDTYEWTYTGDTSSLSNLPARWCLRDTSTCAQFFGGITGSSKYALMWQWSGGGGTYNGVGDFDQIDGNRTP